MSDWYCIFVGASPPPTCYHRPSSEARSSELANLDPSGGDVFWPWFHPALMHRAPEDICAYLCSLGISQTCGGREGTECIKWRRETDRMPGVRIVTEKIETRQREKCALRLCLCECKSERMQRMIERMRESGKIQIRAVWDSRITNGFSSLRASH